MQQSMLTNNEKEDLHLALLAHLEVQGFNKTKVALKKAADVKKPTEKAHRKIIPDNWRAIVRLRRKITQLEEKNKQLKEDIKNFGVVKKNVDPLPKKPAKHSFDKHTAVITAVAFHPKYPSLASASEDASIIVWNADSGEVEQELRGHQDAVNCVAYSPIGNTLASCSADMSIKIWDVDDGKCIKTIAGHEHNVSSLVYSLNGKYLLSCSRDKTIRKWDVATGAGRAIYKGHNKWVRVVCISPDKNIFASGAQDKLIKLWEFSNSKNEAFKTIGGDSLTDAHTMEIECLCFSNANADRIIIKNLLKGDIQKEEKLAAKKRDAKYAEQKKEDPGGAFLISGSRDMAIKMYSVHTGKIVLNLPGAHNNWVRGLIFHPTGKYFMSCSDDKSIKVWNIEKGGQLELQIPTAHELFVTCLAWCSSMDLMASGGVDYHVKVWDCTP